MKVSTSAPGASVFRLAIRHRACYKYHNYMKSSILLTIAATFLFASCAGSGHLSKSVQSLNIGRDPATPVVVISPMRSADFVGFASAESVFVETEVRNAASDAIGQFERFQQKSDGADATLLFDSIRHGVTHVGDGLYAPIVETRVRVVDARGKTLLRRSNSATSGEVHDLDTFMRTPGLYRDAVSVSARKLALELAGGL